jgi:hypothetical protein
MPNIPKRVGGLYYAGKEDSHARAYEPVAPAREEMAAAAMHVLARRARMRIAPAPLILAHEPKDRSSMVVHR